MAKDGGKGALHGFQGGSLGDSPSHLMHRALQLAQDIYTAEMGPGGLTQRQFAVLETAARREGLTQTELVRATGIDRSTLADLVARMTARGLLTRERSVADGRAKAVSLSDEGRLALEAARPRVDAADLRILALLPKARRKGFMTLLTELAAVADAGPEQEKAARRAEKLARKARKQVQKIEQKRARQQQERPAPAGKGGRRKGSGDAAPQAA